MKLFILVAVLLVGVVSSLEGEKKLNRLPRHMFPARVIPEAPTPAPKCKFGTIPAKSENSDCYQLPCVDRADCQVIFGVNSTCHRFTSKCICDDRHTLDQASQTCSILKKEKFPTCSNNFECSVPNSECALGKCRCQFGYVQSETGCSRLYCDRSNDLCRQQIGPNTRCNYNECACDVSYSLDWYTKQCKSSKRAINSFCTSDSECGDNAACSNYLCKCQVGSVPDPTYKFPINCKTFACNFNSDCNVKFNHTKCQFNQCNCDDYNGYKLNSNGESCVPKYKKLGETCFSSMECGFSANCVLGQCKCQSGNKPKLNKMDCESAFCSFDSECQALDINSRCYFSSCSCNDGFETDYLTQSCVVSNYNYMFTATASAVAMVSLVSIILTVIIVAIRRSQQSALSQSRPPSYTTATVSAKVSLPQKS